MKIKQHNLLFPLIIFIMFIISALCILFLLTFYPNKNFNSIKVELKNNTNSDLTNLQIIYNIGSNIDIPRLERKRNTSIEFIPVGNFSESSLYLRYFTKEGIEKKECIFGYFEKKGELINPKINIEVLLYSIDDKTGLIGFEIRDKT